MGLRGLLTGSNLTKAEREDMKRRRRALEDRAALERRRQACGCDQATPKRATSSKSRTATSSKPATPKPATSSKSRTATSSKASAPKTAAPRAPKRITIKPKTPRRAKARRAARPAATLPSKRAPVTPLADARQAAAQLSTSRGSFTGSQLAAALKISDAEVGPVLARLQASGYVRRGGVGYVSS